MKTRLPISERLERRREIDGNGCWIWTGYIQNAGYGAITIQTDQGPKRQLVHRVSFETYVAPIPAGRVIDHLCRNRACFNPAHLDPVTSRENLMRSPIAPAALNAAKTECPKGHPYDTENTIIQRHGGRLCRVCQAAPRKAA